MNLAIMPYVDQPQLTRDAIADVLAQSVRTTLLLIDNGSKAEGRRVGVEYAQQVPDRVFLWQHDPPLPSLSRLWNQALGFAWACGCGEAWVVNNDVRVWGGTYGFLSGVRRETDALFVSATGVTPAQYRTWCATPHIEGGMPPVPLPGPDFSCFLITKACHDKYHFDEGYVPAYCEDLDYHRRLMLGGDGARIFGTGLPFEHLGSGTLSGMDPEKRARKEAQISAGSRAHHARKWGGGANAERYTTMFQSVTDRDGVTTAELFERVRNGQPAI